MTAAAAQPAVAVNGPPDPQLIRIRDLIYQSAGIFHPDNKLGLLLDRCSRRMKQIKANTLREYIDSLTVRPNRQAELIALLNEITIGETCFFRNQPQLDAFRQIVIPKLIAAKAREPVRRLRVWSAGCSTGEEPYTLSILALEQARSTLNGWALDIVATDLNENSLEYAKQGIYGTYSTRNLTPYIAQKYFTPVGEQLQVKPEVRTHITFHRVNLSDDAHLKLMRGFDAIFCCNVLIYFDLASKTRVVEHFLNSLLPHGYLFLGHSESLYGVNDNFRLVHFPRASAYIRAERRESGK
jgi:chemotaxis protein methyltransferase CheR